MPGQLFIALLCLFFFGMGPAQAAKKNEADNLNLVPWPKSVKVSSGAMTLGANSKIVFQDPSLEPLARLLAAEILNTRWLRLAVAQGKPSSGDIALVLDKKLTKERYTLSVSDKAQVTGGNYRAVAWGTVTLLQALANKGDVVQLPKMNIDDESAVEYRGVLIDVGRKYHPPASIKELIVMCRLYKINYMQLHLTDDQLFAFPTKHFPSLPSRDGDKILHFTREELLDLVQYADNRGVTLVPELETPGHSRILRSIKTFGRPGLHCVNMTSEEAYEGFDKLIGEISEVFKSSPFFHIGTDEAVLTGTGTTAEDKAYMAKHNLEHKDIFDHHVVRLDEIVKKYGKQTIRWGGFRQEEKERVRLPKDIIHMVWQVTQAGTVRSTDRPIINAAWRPLYVVGSKAWLPEFLIDNWHNRLWQFHMSNNRGTEATPDVPVFGAQMCAWEQTAEVELGSLRWRLPAMCERIYNPDCGRDYADFTRRFEPNDLLLDRVFSPVQCDVDGLLGAQSDRAFTGTGTFALSGVPGSAIRYTLDGTTPTASSTLYSKPFQVRVEDVKPESYCHSRAHGRYLRTTPRLHVKAACFDENGAVIGSVRDDMYHAIAPLATVKIYYSPKMRDNTKPDWMEAHDWEKMGTKPDKEVIWPNLVFAMPLASRDAVCVPHCSGVISKGKIKIPADDQYAFLHTDDGGEVYIDGKLVTQSNSGRSDVVKLTAGPHDIEVRYAYPGMFNWGTQTLQYARIPAGQSLDSMVTNAKGKSKWKMPKVEKGSKGTGPWRDHAELLIPLDEKTVSLYKLPARKP